MISHIDYADVIYNQPSTESFSQKIESVQYKAALAITGAIQDTSRETIYMELSLESIKSRRWFRRLCYMFKIMNNQAPEYLNNLIPKRKQSFNSRNIYISSYNCRTEYFKFSFPLPHLTNRSTLIRVSEIHKQSMYLKKLFPFIRPLENSLFNIFDPEGLELPTPLHLGFSHLNEHRFQHNF